MRLSIRSGQGVIHKFFRNVVHPIAQVALPPALVDEGHEGVDVRAAGAAPHDGVGRDHR